MRDNSVEIDRSVTPNRLVLSPSNGREADNTLSVGRKWLIGGTGAPA